MNEKEPTRVHESETQTKKMQQRTNVTELTRKIKNIYTKFNS